MSKDTCKTESSSNDNVPEYMSMLSDFSPAGRLDILNNAEQELAFIVQSVSNLYQNLKCIDSEGSVAVMDEIPKISEAFSHLYLTLSYTSHIMPETQTPNHSSPDGAKLRFDMTSSAIGLAADRLDTILNHLDEFNHPEAQAGHLLSSVDSG